MRRSLTADEVMQEIAFELAQGAISKDELGQSIQTVKKYQNQLRGEIFQEKRSTPDSWEAISRLFQLNDMLLTLLQEMSAAIQTTRLELYQSARLPQRPVESGDSTSLSTRPTGEATLAPPMPLPSMFWEYPASLETRAPTEVEEAMREETLALQMDVRASGLPVLGGFIRRTRIALHDLSLFYVGRLAKKQGTVNRTYGSWLLHLNEHSQQQQLMIESLSEQVALLQKRVEELESRQ